MQVGDTFSGARFKVTRCRGDSLQMQFKVRGNAAPDDCGVVVLGDPIALEGYAVAATGRVLGTGRIVPITTRKAKEGSSTEPAEFTLEVSPGNLGFAFEEGALRLIEVRVQASRIGDTYTLLKGTIRMKDSASQVGT